MFSDKDREDRAGGFSDLEFIEGQGRMIVCELCLHYQQDGECGLGLKIPKGMSCREFGPGLERFCSNPNDFVSSNQIVQMATFFGMKGKELKKVKLMAAREESARTFLKKELAHVS